MAAVSRLPPIVAEVVRRFLDSDAPRVAAFDADGTLWRGDVGEDFLRYLASERLLVHNDGAYARYDALHAETPERAYAFAVEVMAGLVDAELSAHAATFFERRFVGRVFSFVRPLLETLTAAGVECWVCSASPRWIVEAGAHALSIPRERVIGVDAELVAGRLTATVKSPVTAGQGKVTWLSRRGVTPGLAAGNGSLDQAMLEAAAFQLVIAPFDGNDTRLVDVARERGWPILRT